jgi:iron complex outermembrane receptor protein
MRRDHFRLTIVAAAVLSALSSTARADTLLNETVVTASRSEQTIFDAPGSIDSVNRERIEASGPQINISESLGLVPGINVANRNNYAQDLQISIRGFGSRAPFGVRGVRLMVDGLPQSLPDGQGQTSQFAASSTSRIEVLRGPLAALYGNASGGVIQAFTRDPSEKPELTVTGYAGSDELYRSSIQYSETRGDYGLVFDYGALSSEGFRQYSAAERHHINTKLVKKGEGSKTTFILNALDQKKSEDPGSRTVAEFANAPYAANAGNLGFKAGKKFVQAIAGVVHESSSQGGGWLTLRASVSSRDLDNPGRSDSLTGTANWILINRIQHSLGADYQTPVSFSGVGGKLSFGVEVDQVKDARTAKTFRTNGTIAIPLSRDEDNTASNTGIFARGDWFLSDANTVTTGIRLTQVKLQVKDYFPTGVIGSGSRTYTGVSPVIGLVRHVSPVQNLYVNFGQSFETPTLNEVLYTPITCNPPTATTCTENKFYGLDPASSRQLEAGWKFRHSQSGFLIASVFLTRTKNDIVPEFLSSFAASWQNVNTERKGLELGGQWRWSRNFSSAVGFTLIDATYRQNDEIRTSSDPTVIRKGNKLPNIPSDRTQIELRYRSSEMAKKNVPVFQSTLELISVGEIYVRSDNTEKTSRYNLANLSLSANKPLGQGFVTGYLRVDNLTDKLYAASTIGDQEAGRYYEPGAPRNWLLGLKYSVAL